MRLLSLRFRHVGTFGAEGVALDNLSSGLNVISETNEFGKSTILKALEIFLFKPFSGADKQVKAITTDGSDQGPECEIHFISDHKNYVLKKKFLKGKFCILEDGQGNVLTQSREADERLANILNSNDHEKGPSGLLWVRQGESMDAIKDKDEIVASRLEGELTTLVGGDRARLFLTRVQAELSDNLTPKGLEKGKGQLKQARLALEQTKADLAHAKAELLKTQSFGVDLEKTREEIKRLSEGFDPKENAKELETTREAIAAAKAREGEIEKLIAQRDHKAQLAKQVEQTRDAHIEAMINFNNWTKEISELEAEQAERRKTLDAKKVEKATLSEERQILQSQFEAFDKTRQDRAKADALKFKLDSAGQDLARLSSVVETYDDLMAQRVQLDGQLSDLPSIRRENLSSLQRLFEQDQRISAEIAGLTTCLYLELSDEGAGKVTLGDKVLHSGPVALSGGDQLEIKGIGRLRSDDGNLQDLVARQRDIRDELSEALDIAGVANLEEAREFADTRHDLETDRKRLVQDLAKLAPQGEQALRDEMENLRISVESLSDKLSDYDAMTEVDMSEENDIRPKLNALNAKLDVLADQIGEINIALASKQAELENIKTNLAALKLAATEAARQAEADKRAGDKLKAESEARQAQLALDAAQDVAPNQSLDLLNVRLKRLEDLSLQTRERLQMLRETEASLNARRDAAFEGEDAQAQVKALEDLQIVQTEALEKLERKVAAQILLRDTLLDSQSRLRDAYTDPVRAELAPLLAMVLPGAEAQFDEQLGANKVLRAGRVEEIGQLSGGTREQIAILTRLAFARLLKRGGANAPVILDDALVYADDARRDTMFDVLNHVSAKSADGEDGLQLIYLSCHQGATQRLGGHRVTPKAWPEIVA